MSLLSFYVIKGRTQQDSFYIQVKYENCLFIQKYVMYSIMPSDIGPKLCMGTNHHQKHQMGYWLTLVPYQWLITWSSYVIIQILVHLDISEYVSSFRFYCPRSSDNSLLVDLTNLSSHKYIKICSFQNMFGFFL